MRLLLGLILALPLAAQPALVQWKGGTWSSGSSITLTLDSASTAGNLIVVVSELSGSFNLTATDSGSNTYTEYREHNSARSLFYSITTASATTITCGSGATANSGWCMAAEFSGVSAYGTNAGGSGGYDTTVDTPTITVSSTPTLLVGTVHNDGGPYTYTPGSGWTSVGTHVRQYMAYRVVSSTGDYNFTTTISSSNLHIDYITSFTGTSGGSAAKPRRITIL